MVKQTIKEQVLGFVESQPGGIATFTQIQRFIYDSKYGAGSYDQGWGPEKVRVRVKSTSPDVWEWVEVTRNINSNRGYFCAGFFRGVWSAKTGSWNHNGYLLRGAHRLQRISRGKYAVVRENVTPLNTQP